MEKTFAKVEEMIADELFLAWFYKEDAQKQMEWENWLSQNRGYQPMADEAVRIMASLSRIEQVVPDAHIDTAYKKLNEKLDMPARENASVIPMKRTRNRWWMAAAAVLLLAVAAAIYKFSAPASVIETPYGQVAQQQLPDGSEVMLNANTVVRLGKGWENGEDREVWLKGEAFFHVKKTTQKNRFIVHTDQLDVIVTGTQFNVRSANGKTSVLLTEGSVTIRTADGQELLLAPGDFVEIENNKAEKIAMNQEMILAWKDNKLNFEKTAMRDVATMINNHYGVEVKLADESVAEKTITGMMPNNNLDDLLKALEATTEFKISRTNNRILIERP
jgi:ferric-dicitrate binding protein FerR (iron transport regulator)